MILKNLGSFPSEVEYDIGFNLYEAQQGRMPGDAKVMRGYGGVSVLEIVSNFDTDTFRAVDTVEFEEAIYVLHCFQKKSKRGTETPKLELDMIDRRLNVAREEHEKWQKENATKKRK